MHRLFLVLCGCVLLCKNWPSPCVFVYMSACLCVCVCVWGGGSVCVLVSLVKHPAGVFFKFFLVQVDQIVK